MDNVVYKAEVSFNDKVASYIGQSSTPFKTRYNNHIQSFKHKKYSNTTLSNFIWNLKDAGINYTINWKIEAKSKSYTTSSRNCRLCNMEKTLILFNQEDELLNKRSELLNKCRHRKKHTLSNG